jgi:predicted DNA-binding transcriptional regulator YafY
VVHAPADEVRGRLGWWGTVEALDDRRCTVTFSAEDPDWPLMALGATGAEFEVVAPAAMVDHLAERATRFRRGLRASRSG